MEGGRGGGEERGRDTAHSSTIEHAPCTAPLCERGVWVAELEIRVIFFVREKIAWYGAAAAPTWATTAGGTSAAPPECASVRFPYCESCSLFIVVIAIHFSCRTSNSNHC